MGQKLWFSASAASSARQKTPLFDRVNKNNEHVSDSRIANIEYWHGFETSGVVVAMKLCCYPGERPPISAIASDVRLSPSEVHGALKRLQVARLLHGKEMKSKTNVSALVEFLLHGFKYVFTAELGQPTRGLPTSYAALPLNAEILRVNELPPVWPWHEGHVRGISFQPLYKTVPVACSKDPLLYEYPALLDAVRSGRARERSLAERELVNRLRSANTSS